MRQFGPAATWIRAVVAKGASLTAYRYVRPPYDAAAEGDRLCRVARLPVAYRLEADRRQRAIGGHQIADRLFLAHRQQPAAVDHHLGVERGQAVDETPPVLLSRRHRLRNQPRIARL